MRRQMALQFQVGSMKILLASGNQGKLKEIREMTSHLSVQWESLSSLAGFVMPEETGKTFVDNGILKAGAAAVASGLVSIGEDSGLCVDALDGGPGIYSARFAGEHGNNEANNDKLIASLADVPLEKRGAHYACAMAVVFPEEKLRGAPNVGPGCQLITENEFLPSGHLAWVTEGQVQGRILSERAGTGGFGYDPLFYYPDFGKTFAQSSSEAKNKVSHRSQAMGRFLNWLSGSPLQF